MLKVFGYFKRYWKLIFLTACLALVQAYCDLELPKYMSNMINIGIRQNGIDDWLPDVFSQKTFGEIKVFISDADYGELQNKYYVGINAAHSGGRISEKEYASLKKKYTALEASEVYILKTSLKSDYYKGDLNDADIEYLRGVLKVPVIVYAVFNEMFPVSAVQFLQNKEFLAIFWAGFAIGDFVMTDPGEGYPGYQDYLDAKAVYEAARNDYVMANDDKSLTDFFEMLLGYSQTPPSGIISVPYCVNAGYGERDKKAFMEFVAAIISNDTQHDMDDATRALLRETLQNIGYPPDSVDSIIEMAIGTSFNGVDKEITDYIFEMGNAEYKVYEYQRAGADTHTIQINYVIENGLFMLLYTLISIVSVIFIVKLAAAAAAGIARDLRRDLFNKVQSFSNAEFDKFSTASLITRTTNDVNQVYTLGFLLIKNVIYAPLVVGGGLYYVSSALGINARMLYIIFIAIGVLAVGSAALFFVVVPKFNIMQKLLDRMNLVARERLGGIFVVKANDNESYEEERYEEVNRKIAKVNLFVNRILAIIAPFMILFMNILGVVVIWYTIYRDLLITGAILPGSLLAFIQYIVQIISAFIIVALIFIFLPRAAVAMKRIAEVLAVKPSVADPEKPVPLGADKFDLRFENVGFKYGAEDNEVLKDISFDVKAGEVTAVVGATGSGKTTLINLLLRFYDPTEGVIYAGDTDIRLVAQEEYRKRIGYVPQQPVLFSGTIRENFLAADENASTADMDGAIEIARAEDFVNDREFKGVYDSGVTDPDKYDAVLSSAGKNLSGGQKQRLSIARAVVRKPDIYIFDDSFSALDYVTEASLRAELIRETKKRGTGVLIVSQRIASVLNADSIVVLGGGRVIGRGNHKQLMKDCTEYREIAASQLPKEELGI
ncbi:MAG: ABC transporter ATP-binding protein [Clostridiales bacterium]|jgi:ATP-binding cassette subfamily B protein|nr:ABC transporter ATP-binding protein [Clostridiales bacterium]